MITLWAAYGFYASKSASLAICDDVKRNSDWCDKMPLRSYNFFDESAGRAPKKIGAWGPYLTGTNCLSARLSPKNEIAVSLLKSVGISQVV